MQVRILSAFLLVSSSLIFSTVLCDPNHHHNHQNELYTSESTVEVLKSETKDGIETLVVTQDGTGYKVTSSNSGSRGLAIGYKVGIPIVSILCFIFFCYCICKYCCGCCGRETPGVVIMQSNAAQTHQPAPAPQIILQQPIIHQQAPPMYDTQQRWAQPPPQWNQPPPHGHPQWNQPPQGPPQWAPHPMGEQQQYSPHDNPGFNPATAPPPYNTGKY